MKRISLARGVFASSALSLAALVVAFASCANTDETGDTTPENTEASVPAPKEVDAGFDVAEPVDGGCDAGDPSCVTKVVTCDEVDWCSVKVSVSPYHMLTAIWGSSANDVWAAGSGGTMLHYDGTTWTPTATGVKNTFNAVWGSGPNDIYAVSSTDVILHSTGFVDGAATWTIVPTPVIPASATFVRSVWGSSADDVRIGSRNVSVTDPVTKKTTCHQFSKYTLADGGIGWQPRSGSGTIYGIWGSSADDVWMVADNSTGVAYQRALTLHGTPADAGADAAPPDGGYPVGATPERLTWTPVDSQANVTLEAVWGSSAADVWAVGVLGTIRHITPSDVRWQKVESPTTETLHSIWGSGPNDIWAVGDAGTIVHYDGTTFKLSTAQFQLGKKPNLYGVWGSGPNDVWIVGDGILLHYTGKKGGSQ